jgi:hypothetical protein
VEALEGDGWLNLVRDGRLIDRLPVSRGTARLESRFRLAAGEAHWVRLEVCDPGGELLALTNPVFVGPVPQAAAGKFGDYYELTP